MSNSNLGYGTRMNINLIFIPESTVEASNDDIDILEERVEVHDGQLAQVL